MQIKNILTTLVESPECYWGDNPRQMEKLKKRVNKAIEKLGLTSDELVDEVIMLSELRLKAKAKTIFLSNMGSSGSHLFQACIARAWPSIPLGEIYLPKKLIEDVEPLTKDEKNLVCEAYLLLHDYTYSERYNTTAFLVNTLHHPTISKFSQWCANYSSALIVRNPVDIVISRTFRKNEYREYLGKASDKDSEYLEANIKKILDFYFSADQFGHEQFLSFEELLSVSGGVSEKLISLAGRPIPTEIINKILRDTLESGEETNKFSGGSVKVDDSFRKLAREKLNTLCLKLGY